MSSKSAENSLRLARRPAILGVMGCASWIVGPVLMAIGTAVAGPMGALVAGGLWVVVGYLQHQQHQIDELREKAENPHDDYDD